MLHWSIKVNQQVSVWDLPHHLPQVLYQWVIAYPLYYQVSDSPECPQITNTYILLNDTHPQENVLLCLRSCEVRKSWGCSPSLLSSLYQQFFFLPFITVSVWTIPALLSHHWGQLLWHHQWNLWVRSMKLSWTECAGLPYYQNLAHKNNKIPTGRCIYIYFTADLEWILTKVFNLFIRPNDHIWSWLVDLKLQHKLAKGM